MRQPENIERMENSGVNKYSEINSRFFTNINMRGLPLEASNKNIADGILFTDQYQLTMAQLYFKLGFHEKIGRFEHFFREYPDYGAHKAGYCINAGLEWFVDWMKNKSFGDIEIDHLARQKTRKGDQLFHEDFLKWLKKHGSYECLTLHSIEEGRVVHPFAPINIVQGPMIMAQIIETALLNQMNYQILIATKAARIHDIGRGCLLLEFGARRGQDRGAIAGARAALIGGADFTSNVGISQMLSFPPKGTHAHSMVQLFLTLGMTELEAFQAFAELYPDDCILLVDTVNTLQSGIPNAIKVFQKLKKKGHQPVGIRLDSGDLAYLSIQAAKMLNKAGFSQVNIVLSGDLDEMNIWQIIDQITKDAPRYGLDPDGIIDRLTYGVGTRLITSSGCPALGGVYKLVAVNDSGEWKSAIKISENVNKIINPGEKKLWRLYDEHGKATADLIGFIDEQPENLEAIKLHHPSDHTKSRSVRRNRLSKIEPLLKQIYCEGKICYEFPSIELIRKKRVHDVEYLDAGVKRLINPHVYHVSLSERLWNDKQRLIQEIKASINNKS